MKPSDFAGFRKEVRPDYPSLINNVLLRKGTPKRVHFMELFLDGEMHDAVDRFFGISESLDRNDPYFEEKRYIELHRRLGYDTVGAFVWGFDLQYAFDKTADTMEGEQSRTDRNWIDEHRGPIATWEDFEKYPWPDLTKPKTEAIERLIKVLPDDMCLFGRDINYCESLCWLFGYETLCYALFDQPDLVNAVIQKIDEVMSAKSDVIMSYPQVKFMFASDDLGFKTGLMISPDDTRRLVLPGHKKLAARWHATGRPYILHACGKRSDILEDLIEDVKIDAIHSFEDTIELVTDAKKQYGKRMSVIGGIDVDFIIRSSDDDLRKRVRKTIETCQGGGGWALGTGNTVANYIPLEKYLIMMDEGRQWGA